MAIADRRAREKESLRQKILDTARDLFVAHGYEGVTLRKIADAIEYAPGTIYSYFKDKGELMYALCLADWEDFEQSYPRGAGSADPLAAIRAQGKGYIRFALAHPNQYRLMFMSPRPPEMQALEADMSARRGDPAQDAYALLRKTVEAAIDGGLLREGARDADLVAQTLWAGAHGMASLEITMLNHRWISWAPAEARAEAMIDVLIRGLVADAKP